MKPGNTCDLGLQLPFTFTTENISSFLGDGIMNVKGIEPFMVKFARLAITIEPIVLGIVYTSPK